MPHTKVNTTLLSHPSHFPLVDEVVIAMNKYLSHNNQRLVAYPRNAILTELGGAYSREGFSAQIVVVEVSKDGVLSVDQKRSQVKSLCTTIPERAVSGPPEGMDQDLWNVGKPIKHALVKDGKLIIGGVVFDIPDTIKPFVIPDATDEEIDMWYADTKPSRLHQTRTNRDDEVVTNESKLGTPLEAGVAEGITLLHRTNPEHPMFAKLPKGRRYMAVDTQRIKNKWWNRGTWAAAVDTKSGVARNGRPWSFTTTKGDEHEKMIQNDLGIDIIMVPVSSFKKPRDPICMDSLKAGKYLTFQTKCSPYAVCGHGTYFVENQNRNDITGEISPSGLYKTIADWYGYITTSKVVAWLPTETFKTLLPGTPRHDAATFNEGYKTISMGHLVGCDTVLQHSSVCTTSIYNSYATAFEKAHRRDASLFDKEQDIGLTLGTRNPNPGDIAQNWSVEQCLAHLNGTLEEKAYRKVPKK